ncbi:hypothetical protein Golomagni_04684 [Golovinomyces magnicellulatus]|nr:hypothetical protein Golomagni_04684 [Golovinomyces magnicellulatus]
MAGLKAGKSTIKKKMEKGVVNDGKPPVDSYKTNKQNVRLKQAKMKKQRKGFFRLTNILRLFIWVSIFTVFYCPSSNDLLIEDSPKICIAYYRVSDFVAPTFQPYFEKFATPYIEPILPYYLLLKRRVITPTMKAGKRYGKPIVTRVQDLGGTYWQKYIHTYAQKYYEVIEEEYIKTISSYVDFACTAVSPYCQEAEKYAQITYSEIIMPNYRVVKPRIIGFYKLVSDIVVKNLYPFAKWTFKTGKVFLTKTLAPKLVIIYGESVEPQLKKIGKRLGRYRDVKGIKSAHDINDLAPVLTFCSTTRYPQSETLSPVLSTYLGSSSAPASIDSKSVDPEPTPVSDLEIREKAQQIVARDLRYWQEKFSKAADDATDELEIHINEITNRYISSHADIIGEKHISELKKAVPDSLRSLRTTILSIIQESDDTSDARDKVVNAVRKSGSNIKEKAQVIRKWKQNYSQQMIQNIKRVTEDTLEVLDTIRDAGLQEVGMRWAWTDGITYKDWIKYHAVKTKFAEWRLEIEKMAAEHPELGKALDRFQEIEIEALKIAENAAKELALLKEIGIWKLSIKDGSDEFPTANLPRTDTEDAEEVLGKPLDSVTDVSSYFDLILETASLRTFQSEHGPSLNAAEKISHEDKTIKSDISVTSQSIHQSVIPLISDIDLQTVTASSSKDNE